MIRGSISKLNGNRYNSGIGERTECERERLVKLSQTVTHLFEV